MSRNPRSSEDVATAIRGEESSHRRNGPGLGRKSPVTERNGTPAAPIGTHTARSGMHTAPFGIAPERFGTPSRAVRYRSQARRYEHHCRRYPYRRVRYESRAVRYRYRRVWYAYRAEWYEYRAKWYSPSESHPPAQTARYRLRHSHFRRKSTRDHRNRVYTWGRHTGRCRMCNHPQRRVPSGNFNCRLKSRHCLQSADAHKARRWIVNAARPFPAEGPAPMAGNRLILSRRLPEKSSTIRHSPANPQTSQTI